MNLGGSILVLGLLCNLVEEYLKKQTTVLLTNVLQTRRTKLGHCEEHEPQVYLLNYEEVP